MDRNPLNEFQHVPRDIAVRVLTRVLSDRQPLDEALASFFGEVPSPAGRAWLQEVCSGTLRWKGRIDLILDSVALKKKPTGWLRKILSIAAYQLLIQERTPPAVVVMETVDQVRAKEGDRPAAFANAVLRKISDHVERWRDLPMPEERDEGESVASWASLPGWLWKRLVREQGVEWAKAYAVASLERPALWVRAKHPGWGSELAEAGPVPGSWKIKRSGPVTAFPGFNEGAFLVQDISGQTLVFEISVEVDRNQGGMKKPVSALDLCAAPGGKAVGLAWNGYDVTATDLDVARYALLEQTVRRLATQVRIAPRAEVGTLPAFDLVWVDAPCTGTGIIRRHPDVRWLRQEREVEGLLKVQRQLLREAWEKVRPGGFLAYSVCSVLKEEGPRAIEDCGLSDFRIREWFLVTHEPPYGDGFWAALLRKS